MGQNSGGGLEGFTYFYLNEQAGTLTSGENIGSVAANTWFTLTQASFDESRTIKSFTCMLKIQSALFCVYNIGEELTINNLYTGTTFRVIIENNTIKAQIKFSNVTSFQTELLLGGWVYE